MRYSPQACRTARGALIFLLAASGATSCSPTNDSPGSTSGTGGAPAVGGSGGSGNGGSGSGGATATGTGGSSPGGGTGGAVGSGGTTPPPSTDAATDVSPSSDAPTMPPPTGQKILLNMLSTSFRHDSEVPASQVLRDKLTALGFDVQIAKDPALFSDAGLAPFKVVVMVQASGDPAGPAAGVEALIRWVKNGGGLVGFHGATVLNGGPYVSFLGGSFAGHPGGIRPASCDSVGTHPTVVKMAKPFNTRDEIYTFANYNAQNQVVLTCGALGGGAPLPISWYRIEGTGRVFYTAMGHGNELWTATSGLVNDHVVPGILWAAGR